MDESDKLVCQLLLDKKDIVQRVQNREATLYFYSIRVHNRETDVSSISKWKAEWLRCNDNDNLIGNVTQCYHTLLSKCEVVIKDDGFHDQQTVKTFTYNFDEMSFEMIHTGSYLQKLQGVLQVREAGKRVYSTDAEKEDAYMESFRDDILKIKTRALNNESEKKERVKQNKQKRNLIHQILQHIVNRVKPQTQTQTPEQNYSTIRKYTKEIIQFKFSNTRTPITVGGDTQYQYVIEDELCAGTHRGEIIPYNIRQIIVYRANDLYLKFIYLIKINIIHNLCNYYTLLYNPTHYASS